MWILCLYIERTYLFHNIFKVRHRFVFILSNRLVLISLKVAFFFGYAILRTKTIVKVSFRLIKITSWHCRVVKSTALLLNSRVYKKIILLSQTVLLIVSRSILFVNMSIDVINIESNDHRTSIAEYKQKRTA